MHSNEGSALCVNPAFQMKEKQQRIYPQILMLHKHSISPIACSGLWGGRGCTFFGLIGLPVLFLFIPCPYGTYTQRRFGNGLVTYRM